MKKQQKTFYQSIGSIFCPAVNQDVKFTSKGFNHLIYKANYRIRNTSEQYLKLKLLRYVPEALKSVNHVYVIRSINRKNDGTVIVHTSFVYVYEKGIIRIVIEKIGNGKYHFLSVMPHRNSEDHLHIAGGFYSVG